MARILIADDEWLTRQAVEEMLTGLGYEVVGQAESGREAVDMARELKPDLILMDVVMPGEIDGIQAAREIKTALDIPIIFISGYGDPETIEAANQVEPLSYVMKPFDEKEMRAFVEVALYKREMELRLRKANDQLQQKSRELAQQIDHQKEGLKISEERLRRIIDFLPDATFVIDTQGRVVAWNRAIEKMTGIGAKDMLGKGDFEYAIPFYGERRPILIDLVSRWDKETEAAYLYVKKEGDILVSETYDCLVRPGGTLWNTASLLYDENGEVTGAIESIRDITERKGYEKSLRESEERYRTLFEQARDAIVITTERGHVIDANSYALNLFGYTREEMLALNFQRLYVNPDDGHRFLHMIQETGTIDEFVTRLRRSDGSEMDCTFNAVVHRNKIQGTILGYQGIIRDITESRRLQMQVQESQKMEAIATLAGGIAHQFNNALTPIIGNIDLLQMDHAEDDDLMDGLNRIKASARRMAQLTSQLLAYARGGKYHAQVLSMADFISDTIRLTEHTLQSDALRYQIATNWRSAN